MIRPFHRSLVQTGCMLLALMASAEYGAVSSALLVAQETTKDNAQPAEEEVSEPADERAVEKRRKAMAGLMAVAGILIGGVMFLAVVVIWGARMRRVARGQLPSQTTLQNDLWFLKPPKPASADQRPEPPEPLSSPE